MDRIATKRNLNHPVLRSQFSSHDDVIKWKHFPRYWPFVQGIHRSTVNSPYKSQWRGALMFSLICTWINGWVSNREAGDLRRHRAHHDVTIENHVNNMAAYVLARSLLTRSLAGMVWNFSDARGGISRLVWSIPCLPMHWLLKSPMHQQAWYWLRKINNMYCSSRVNLIHLGQDKSKIRFKMWIYLLWSLKQVSMLRANGVE